MNRSQQLQVVSRKVNIGLACICSISCRIHDEMHQLCSVSVQSQLYYQATLGLQLQERYRGAVGESAKAKEMNDETT